MVPDPTVTSPTTLTLQVVARNAESDGVVSLVLADPMRVPLPAWTPGAHIDLHLDVPGQGETVRQYSLCGDPSQDTEYRIAVLRESDGGGGSRHIHDALFPGTLVRVSSPRNLFELGSGAPLVFVAGGIGITPILPMVARAQEQGIDWQLHYAGRSTETMAFTGELEPYAGRTFFYPADQGKRMELQEIVRNAGQAVTYACGPNRLLDALQAAADRHGRDLRVERFVNGNIVTAASDEPFSVELSESGLTLEVLPGESILEVVGSAGVSVPSSCRGGTCGTCETFVLAGRPDHRDAILSAKEREESEVMMICVSRSKGGPITLEL
ncbi:PDR/VanB family oxidoreductase [Arthrobacter ginkgonis]|uniref:PDR/VanB family oxidoreductase n=1 Tax=Arthrobacter ginkgonis TaxID=1630594 RepID=A0ABP7CP07_9MICC